MISALSKKGESALSKKEDDKQSQFYLYEVFSKLRKVKETYKYPNIYVGQKFKGYKTIPIQKLQPRNAPNRYNMDGSAVWRKQAKKLHCYQQSCSLNMPYHNGFFGTFYQAYINHGDVKITPDQVWSTIMIYFSRYVNENAEKLRNAFVSHEGKKQLVIQTSSSSESDWKQFFEKVIIAIRKNTVQGVTQKLECSFSSTNKFFTTFSTALIMNSYKKYFDYTNMMCVCGIQNIHMGGTLEDWQNVAKKLQFLRQFDVNGRLKEYISRLEPVIDQFVETYKGAAHLQFWNNLYHERPNPKSGPYQPKSYANGWILRFFTTIDTIKEVTQLQMEQFDVPVKVINCFTNTTKEMNLVGGCKGVCITNNVYQPHFSFAVVEKKEKKEKNQKY